MKGVDLMRMNKDVLDNAKDYYKNHIPDALSVRKMQYLLFDLGINHIQQEVYLMAARGCDMDEIRAFSDRRYNELLTTLGLEKDQV